MTIKKVYKAKSYKTSDGKWIPSGIILIKDNFSDIEFTKEYPSVKKTSKKDADEYFVSSVKAKK